MLKDTHDLSPNITHNPWPVFQDYTEEHNCLIHNFSPTISTTVYSTYLTTIRVYNLVLEADQRERCKKKLDGLCFMQGRNKPNHKNITTTYYRSLTFGLVFKAK